MVMRFLYKEVGAPVGGREQVVERLSNSRSLGKNIVKVNPEEKVNEKVNDQPHKAIGNPEVLELKVDIVESHTRSLSFVEEH